MEIDTRSTPLFRASATNITTAGTSIANPAPTATKPALGAGVIDMGSGGAISSNGLSILPYGTDTATQTFLLSVFAWDVVHVSDPTTGVNLWVPWILASFVCTLNTVAGIAGTDVNASQLFCGTITLVVGNANVSNEIISPTGNLVASILLDTKGAKMVQLSFARNGSAASMNALCRRL